LKIGIQIPQIASARAMKCGIRIIQDKQVACVLLNCDGVPVTMVVANSLDVRVPESQRRVEKGNEYHVTTLDNLNIVMIERRGRWICLISELPMDRLVEVAGSIEL